MLFFLNSLDLVLKFSKLYFLRFKVSVKMPSLAIELNCSTPK